MKAYFLRFLQQIFPFFSIFPFFHQIFSDVVFVANKQYQFTEEQ